jgi:hypothetical protein
MADYPVPLWWYAVAEWLAWSKRHKALRSTVREAIEAEEGSIQAITIIGLLLRSPFPVLSLRPVYLRAACRYPDDSGAWYICGTDSGTVHWVWCSDSKASRPPISCRRDVSVNNTVLALPRWLSIALYVLSLIGLGTLLVGLAWYS